LSAKRDRKQLALFLIDLTERYLCPPFKTTTPRSK